MTNKKHIYYFSLLVWLTFILNLNGHASKKKQDTVSGYQKFLMAVDKIKTDSNFKHASWGLSVVNLDCDSVIFEYNPQLSLMPASTMKILTTYAALVILGEDFRFKTTLDYTGFIDAQGTLHGDLIITGGGDPTLGTATKGSENNIQDLLSKVVWTIKKMGIQRINGRVIGDDLIFDSNLIPEGYTWNNMGNYYGAPVSGLTIHENTYYLYFNGGEKIGDSTYIVKTYPQLPHLSFQNYVKSAHKGSGDNATIYGGPYANTRIVSGTIPIQSRNFAIKGSVPDPAHYAAILLDNALRENKILVLEEPVAIRQFNRAIDTCRITFAQIFSPPLKNIVNTINTYSNNLYAEHVLKMIGFAKYKLGSTENGIAAIEELLKKQGVDISGFNMTDGSGLSRSNLVTARFLNDVLAKIYNSEYYNTFYNSLPIAGKTGTLRKLKKKNAIYDNLRAKSGTINKVKAYSGYVANSKNELLAFTIIFNNFSCSSAYVSNTMQKLMELIGEIE